MHKLNNNPPPTRFLSISHAYTHTRAHRHTRKQILNKFLEYIWNQVLSDDDSKRENTPRRIKRLMMTQTRQSLDLSLFAPCCVTLLNSRHIGKRKGYGTVFWKAFCIQLTNYPSFNLWYHFFTFSMIFQITSILNKPRNEHEGKKFMQPLVHEYML